jgi:hypothetical protein
MALFLALTLFHHLIDGFRYFDLRSHVADLLGVSSAEYTSNQMTYDLRRLRLKGLLIFIDSRARNYAERSACLVFRQPVQGGALGPSAAPPEDILQAATIARRIWNERASVVQAVNRYA